MTKVRTFHVVSVTFGGVTYGTPHGAQRKTTMRLKMLVSDPSSNRTVGVRVDANKVTIGGPISRQPFVDELILCEDDILMSQSKELHMLGSRFKLHVVFKTMSGLQSVLDRWRNVFVVHEVRSFRRLMR